MEKKMENEMETAIYRLLGAIAQTPSIPLKSPIVVPSKIPFKEFGLWCSYRGYTTLLGI